MYCACHIKTWYPSFKTTVSCEATMPFQFAIDCLNKPEENFYDPGPESYENEAGGTPTDFEVCLGFDRKQLQHLFPSHSCLWSFRTDGLKYWAFDPMDYSHEDLRSDAYMMEKQDTVAGILKQTVSKNPFVFRTLAFQMPTAMLTTMLRSGFLCYPRPAQEINHVPRTVQWYYCISF